ncbi:MAG TPA: L-2-hydroxyglutarate oxidase, partial [Phycisphaerae bacterium]
MPDSSYDLIVIGGGIIGLATALEAVQRFPGLRLLVLEKETRLAAHQTGHNSGVIHSGIYYKPGSIKARTCVQGGAAMAAFCRRHEVPLEVCGKVVVATDESELPRLEELYRRGTANGVPGLAMIGPERLREIEPHSRGIRALHVPGTGITDYALVAAKYAEIIESGGGEIRTSAEVVGLRPVGDTVVETTAGAFGAKYVINCAGLHSDRVSRMAGADIALKIVPFRGEYYEIVPEKHHLVNGLVYPVADPRFPFLGVHFTRRIHGGVEAGPNAVLAFKREGYGKADVNLTDTLETLSYPGFWRMTRKYWRSGMGEFYRSFSKPAFVRALQKLLPELTETDITPGGAGVRAQALDRDGRLVDDFRFIHTERMVHVCNVPSPAATASI